MTKLYVGNLAWTTTEENLTEFFSTYGAVQSAVVVKDRETGRSRGFGFVEMDGDAAENAIREANGQNLLGRPLRVSEAREREAGGGGGGRGPRAAGRAVAAEAAATAAVVEAVEAATAVVGVGIATGARAASGLLAPPDPPGLHPRLHRLHVLPGDRVPAVLEPAVGVAEVVQVEHGLHRVPLAHGVERAVDRGLRHAQREAVHLGDLLRQLQRRRAARRAAPRG